MSKLRIAQIHPIGPFGDEIKTLRTIQTNLRPMVRYIYTHWTDLIILASAMGMVAQILRAQLDGGHRRQGMPTHR